MDLWFALFEKQFHAIRYTPFEICVEPLKMANSTDECTYYAYNKQTTPCDHTHTEREYDERLLRWFHFQVHFFLYEENSIRRKTIIALFVNSMSLKWYLFDLIRNLQAQNGSTIYSDGKQ